VVVDQGRELLMRREDGMTLPEVLVAMVVALVVSLAAFGLVDVVMHRTGTTTNRIAAVQQGRSAMDTITREVRSQVCVLRDSTDKTGNKPTMIEPRAIYGATATSIAFFVDLSDGSKAPDLRTLSFENNQLVERDYVGKLTSSPTSTATATYSYAGYPDTPTRRTVLADNVAQGDFGTGTYFQYFSYDSAKPPQPTVPVPGGTGLTADQLSGIAKISVSFKSLAGRKTKATDLGTVLFTDDVYVRSVDPNSTTPKPECE
jgi:prepilin-type N-terminal cleavage/methylation domain-containing protein